MKIYISVDMEGMAGIVHPRQEYDDTIRFRKALNEQVSWALESIFKSNIANEIELVTVCDAHGFGRNLSWDLTEIDDRITLVSGTPRINYMMSCLDSTYDLIFYLGYHSGVGERYANMAHTYMGRNFHYLKINDKYMNEATVNSLYASELGVPVALIMGDSILKKQIIDDRMMPWIEFVITKNSIGFTAAQSKSKGLVRKELDSAIQKVLNTDLTKLPLYKLDSPYSLEIEFNMATMYEEAYRVPGAIHVGNNTLKWLFDEYKNLFNAIMSIGTIASKSYPNDK